MALTAPIGPSFCPDRPRAYPRRTAPSGLSNLAALEANSHRPEVQALIRDAIRLGSVRVRPVPDSPGRVRLSPVSPGGWVEPLA